MKICSIRNSLTEPYLLHGHRSTQLWNLWTRFSQNLKTHKLILHMRLQIFALMDDGIKKYDFNRTIHLTPIHRSRNYKIMRQPWVSKQVHHVCQYFSIITPTFYHNVCMSSSETLFFRKCQLILVYSKISFSITTSIFF